MTEAFRQLLPDDWEYVFLDGEKEHPPAPGVEKVFPGPYWSYLTDYTTKSMAEQHDYILQIANEEGNETLRSLSISFSKWLTFLGPFDAVLGFSQVGIEALL